MFWELILCNRFAHLSYEFHNSLGGLFQLMLLNMDSWLYDYLKQLFGGAIGWSTNSDKLTKGC